MNISRETIELAIESIKGNQIAYDCLFQPKGQEKIEQDNLYNKAIAELEAALKEPETLNSEEWKERERISELPDPWS